MKKLICLFLIILLTASTVGCAAEPTPTTETTTAPTEVTISPTETSVPEEGGSADYQAPMTAVSFPTVTDARTDDSGRIISEYRFPEFTVSLPDADVAETVTLDLLNRVDATAAAAETMHAAALNNCDAEGFQPYFYEVSYNVRRLDQNILSFSITDTYFDGTPHTLRSVLSVTYDLSRGNVLNLKTIMQEDYSADILAELIVEGLADYTDYLFEDYETTVHDKFSTNVPAENWYFTNEGLCFYFAPYEIAPVALGEVVATIPYEKLSGMLSEQYFPAEQLTYIGQLYWEDLTADNFGKLDSYTQFGELILSAGSSKRLISANGSASNIRIFVPADGLQSTDDIMVFAASGMGSADAIIIDGTAEELDALIITYDSKPNN